MTLHKAHRNCARAFRTTKSPLVLTERAFLMFLFWLRGPDCTDTCQFGFFQYGDDVIVVLLKAQPTFTLPD